MSKIYRAEQALFRLQQGEQSLAQYFTAVKAAYEKLNAIRPPCSACRESHFEKSIVTIFLSGLSSEYESSIGQILSSPELPSLEEVYSRLSRLGLNMLTTDATPASALASYAGHGRGSFHPTHGRGGGRASGG
ncbi:hypothetical protein, partial [Klebsiella pneumoniae]|uniref:hypothetical protein n=1 Tax=Klebsiella pneumoniae TaxID=573 RepID=UPI003531B191